MQRREQIEGGKSVLETLLHLAFEKEGAGAEFLECTGIDGDVKEAMAFAVQRDLDGGSVAAGPQRGDAAGNRAISSGRHVREEGLEAITGERARDLALASQRFALQVDGVAGELRGRFARE